MKVHVFAVCWNEEIALPFFFKHYRERFKDVRFTIFDNMSTDASRKMIVDEGAELLDNDTNGEIRDDLYLQIKNNCWKNTDADWVIVCDIDEWIDCDDEFIEHTTCTIVKPEAYEMIGNSYNLDKITRGFRFRKMDKCILFNPNEIDEINYETGCHRCNPTGNVIYNKERILLYHMKYFKLSYMIKRYKILARRLSQVNKENLWGLTYTKNYRQIIIRYLTVARHSVKIRKQTKVNSKKTLA
jgi:hypothetical protein